MKKLILSVVMAFITVVGYAQSMSFTIAPNSYDNVLPGDDVSYGGVLTIGAGGGATYFQIEGYGPYPAVAITDDYDPATLTINPSWVHVYAPTVGAQYSVPSGTSFDPETNPYFTVEVPDDAEEGLYGGLFTISGVFYNGSGRLNPFNGVSQSPGFQFTVVPEPYEYGLIAVIGLIAWMVFDRRNKLSRLAV